MEHFLNKDGTIQDVVQEEKDKLGWVGCDAFFNETVSGKFVPRAILIDLEPTVIGKHLVI